MGASWAALAAEEDPHGRGREGGGFYRSKGETELEQEGVGSGGGGKKTRTVGRSGGNSARWQLSTKGRISRARPTEAPEECASGLCPVSNPSSSVPSMRTV